MESKAMEMCWFTKKELCERAIDFRFNVRPVVLPGTQPRSGIYSGAVDGYLSCPPPFTAIRYSSGIPVLAVTGEIDAFNAPQLESAGRSAALACHDFLIIDISEAPFLDAAAVGAMLRLSEALRRQKNGRLVLYDRHQPLRAIFRLLRLDRWIPVRHEFDEALHEALR